METLEEMIARHDAESAPARERIAKYEKWILWCNITMAVCFTIAGLSVFSFLLSALKGE